MHDANAGAADVAASTGDRSGRRRPRTTRRPQRASRPRRRRGLAVDLGVLGVVGVLLIAAVASSGAIAYRELYSASAFVEKYMSLLGEGRAADALELPGVSVAPRALRAAGLPITASDVLLRRDALVALSEVEVEGETRHGDVTDVEVSYRAGRHRGSTTLKVARDGWIGVAPAWRFAESPLAAIDLTVRGATEFTVNGFALDTRQVSPDGMDADPLTPVSMLVFSPGMYSISVNTPIATSPGVAVISDAPRKQVPIDLQTEPTQEFVDVVTDRVGEFLNSCATQTVLQPTGCPFGYAVRNRVEGDPKWSMVTQPEVTVVPDGGHWAIPQTTAVAHIDVDVRSLFDGRLYEVSEDVEFSLTGTVTILPDGTASIQVSAAG